MDVATTLTTHHPQGGTTGGEERGLRASVMTVGGELFAVDLRHVREVFELESFTPVPGMPSMVIGVANLRGFVIPLIDLRAMLGLAAKGAPAPFAVVLKYKAHHVGVLVERVPEIRSISRDHMLPAVVSADGRARPFVSGVLKMEERLGGMLDVPLIFSQLESGMAA